MSDQETTRQSVASSAVPQPSLTRALELASRIYDIFSSYQRSEVNIHLCQFEIAKIIDAELRRDCGAVPQASTQPYERRRKEGTMADRMPMTTHPARATDAAVPQPEPDSARCMAESPKWRIHCSLPPNHVGDHAAYELHDPAKPILERWPRPQPLPWSECPRCDDGLYNGKECAVCWGTGRVTERLVTHICGQPERPERCPSCQATDNNPYTNGRGQPMRACGRCMIQWLDTDAVKARHTPAAPAPQIVHAPDPKQPEPLIASHRQCSECGAEVVWGNGQWQHARQAEAGYRQCTRYPYPPVPVREAPAQVGVDLGSGKDHTRYFCTSCGASDEPCTHNLDPVGEAPASAQRLSAKEWLNLPEHGIGFDQHDDCGDGITKIGCERCAVEIAMEAYARYFAGAVSDAAAPTPKEAE